MTIITRPLAEEKQVPGIVWQDPPERPHGGARRRWAPILDVLRDRPGVWALIATDVSVSIAPAITAGRIGGVNRGEFEATLRGTEGGRAAELYARYVGGAK